MKKSYLMYGIMGVAVVTLVTGCSTTPKKNAEEMKGIKSRVETLESRVDSVESRQTEADRMASEQAQATSEAPMAKTNIGIRSKGAGTDDIRETQTCLKNAGYYTGKIDGVKGKNTKHAIKEFQKANGLTPDGVVGKKTRELLHTYAQGSGSK